MFMLWIKFDEIPSLLDQDIKEKPKCHRELQKGNYLTELVLALIFLLQMFILLILMCSKNLLKFHHCLFKLLRKNQNVAD